MKAPKYITKTYTVTVEVPAEEPNPCDTLTEFFNRDSDKELTKNPDKFICSFIKAHGGDVAVELIKALDDGSIPMQDVIPMLLMGVNSILASSGLLK